MSAKKACIQSRITTTQRRQRAYLFWCRAWCPASFLVQGLVRVSFLVQGLVRVSVFVESLTTTNARTEVRDTVLRAGEAVCVLVQGLVRVSVFVESVDVLDVCACVC